MLKFALITVIAAASLFTQNLIQNGDFEAVESDIPAGWTIAPYGGKNTVPTAATDGNIRGKASAHMKHENASAQAGSKAIVLITRAKIGVIGGTEYRLRFAARSPVAGQTLTAYYYTDPSVSPHFYKLKTFTLTDAWKQYDFVLKLPSADEWKDRSLSMRFDIAFGEVFIDDAVLEVNPNEAVKPLAVRPVIPGRKNLLQNSSFEIGAEEYALSRAQYLRGRDSSDIEAAQPVIDAAEKMYGSASVRIDNPNGDGLLFCSRDIPITPGKKYTLSGSFKTAGGIKIAALGLLSILDTGKRKGANVWSEIGSEWKRISVTFDAPADHYYYSLQIGNIPEGHGKTPPPVKHQAGTLWIDGLMLVEGASAAYEPDDWEIGIVLMTNRYYAYTPKEPYRVRFKALNNTGADVPVKFRYSVRDKYFDSIVRKAETAVFTVRGKDTGEIIEDINPGRYGMFVMEYELINAGTGALLDVYSFDYAVIENIMAIPAPKGFTSGGQGNFRANWFAMSWATQPTLAYHGATIAESYDFLANVGDRWYRCWDFGWGHNEVDEGAYEWQVIDRQIEELSKRGIKIVASFDTLIVDEKNPQKIYAEVPKWSQERFGVTDGKGSMKCRVSVPSVEIWARYFTECVKRYKGKVRAYEIFNEPNLWLSPEQYVSFLKAAYEIVRENDPDTLVVGFCATGDLGGQLLKFVKECMRLGAKDYYDVLSFHPYNAKLDSSPTAAEDQIKSIRAALDEIGDNAKQIWNSELFYLEDGLKEYFYGSLAVKGHQFARRLLIDQFHGVARSACLDTGYNRARIAPLSHDIGRKPIPSQFFVINNAWARFFEGAKPLKQIPLAGKNKLYVYERTDGPVAAYWNYSYDTGGNAALVIAGKGKIDLFDLMGNPLVKEAQGNAYTLDAVSEPVYIKPKGIARAEFLSIVDKAEMEFKVPVTVSGRMDYQDGALGIRADVMNYKSEARSLRVAPISMDNTFRADPVSIDIAARGSRAVFIPITITKPFISTAVTYAVSASAERYDLPPFALRYRPIARAVRSAAPVIDGVLGGDEWAGAPVVLNGADHIRNASPSVWGGSTDISGTVSFSWDNNALYLGIQVKDDKRGDRMGSRNVWNSDCIELFIDTAPDTEAASPGFNAQSCQLVIGLPTEKAPELIVQKASGLLDVDAAQLTARTKTIPGGYGLELAIPWKELGITPSENTMLGFDVCLSDSDGAARKLSLVWSGAADYYNSRLNFGRLLLSPRK